MTDDGPLLRRYIEEGSEQAFTELVARQIDLVSSVAARVVNGDTQLARDVVQTVFADLARKARSLSPNVVLGGWLYRHTCFVAAQAVRSERRRQARERQAAEMNSLNESRESSWDEVAPFLEEAMRQLNAQDRDAIVLRFLEQRDLRAVGIALGTSEDAARKRVARALEKLKALLTRRGLALSAAALTSMLGTQAMVSAPAGLAASVAGPALAAAATGASLALTLMNIMATTKLKVGAVSALFIAGLATPLVMQHQSLSRLRAENQGLRDQVEIVSQLREENRSLSNRLNLASQNQSLSKEQLAELMHLRGDVGALRNATNELGRQLAASRGPANASASAQQPADQTAEAGPAFEAKQYFPAEGWADVGSATHAAAMQTFLWAGRSGNLQRLMDVLSLTPQQRAGMASRMDASSFAKLPFAGAKGVNVFAVEEREFGQIKYLCDFDWGNDQPGKRIHFATEQIDGVWKLRQNSQVEDLPPAKVKSSSK